MRGVKAIGAAAVAAVAAVGGLVMTEGSVRADAPPTFDAESAIWGTNVVAVADHEGEVYRVTASGRVTAPDAKFVGDMSETTLNGPIVGMEVDADGEGYWLIGQDGGIFAFDAPFLGSMGGTTLNQPVVDMAAHPNGDGYWFVASDGGIFAFGNAPFHGSMGGTTLNRPIVGMTATATGQGYWMVANDGGLFAFGDAQFHGSLGGNPPAAPVIGMALSPGGAGYWMFDAAGGVYEFGDAPNVGDAAGQLNSPVVGAVPIVVDGEATGFVMVTQAGDVVEITPTPFSGPPGGGDDGDDNGDTGDGSGNGNGNGGDTGNGNGGDTGNDSGDVGNDSGGDELVEPPAGSYAWLIDQPNPDGSPIRWDGCTTIPYWTDLTLAPAGARERVEAVIAVVEQASGYDFVYQGDTTKLSAQFRQTTDYGMLIRWSTEAQEPGLAGGAIGLGGPSATGQWVGDGWNFWIRTGVVQIDAEFAFFNEGWGLPNSLEEVLAHEIGHAMNLNHVDFTNELLYPAAIGVGGLGEGTAYAMRRAQTLPCRSTYDAAFTAADLSGEPPTFTVDVAAGTGGFDVGRYEQGELPG